MLRPLYLLGLLLLLIGAVQSWDIAVAQSSGGIILYGTDIIGRRLENQVAHFSGLNAVTYDALNNKFFFIDTDYDKNLNRIGSFSLSQPDNGARLATFPKPFTPSFYANQIAFDPVNGRVFWSSSAEKSISWAYTNGTSPESKGNVFLSSELKPYAIAIDSCRGYVYWSYLYAKQPAIERARFDLSEREVVVHAEAASLALDQGKGKLYWSQYFSYDNYSLSMSDLDGKNIVVLLSSLPYQPTDLSVTKDYIYWNDSTDNTIWRMSKSSHHSGNPEEYVILRRLQTCRAVVGYYPISEQTEGVPECEVLRNLAL